MINCVCVFTFSTGAKTNGHISALTGDLEIYKQFKLLHVHSIIPAVFRVIVRELFVVHYRLLIMLSKLLLMHFARGLVSALNDLNDWL